MNYLPWIEKYRPMYINDIISHNQNIDTLKKLISVGNTLPHLLFYGPSGTGKTSTIMTIANEIYGSNIKLMTMKLDASDDRGITTVREDIKCFAERSNMFSNSVKLIILDEADSMTVDAQFALRRIIEKYSKKLRFCLICNYENKIIPAIKSRFTNLRFGIINKTHIINRLLYISTKEKINITVESINIIAEFSNGDLRKAINLLQTLTLTTNDINLEICYKILNMPLKKDIIYILSILNDNIILYKNKYNIVYNYMYDNNISLRTLINEIFNYIINNDTILFEPLIISKIANLENILLKNNNDDIYISLLINIFLKK